MCENVNSARKYVEELRQWHEDSSQSKIKGEDPMLCDIGVNTIEDIFSEFNIELESSINLLKSEIWSLNQELEKVILFSLVNYKLVNIVFLYFLLMLKRL